MQYEEYQ